MKDLVNDTYLKLREAVIVFATENKYGNKNDFEKIKITEDEDIFCSGVTDLLTDLKDLEVNVEDIRGGVINKKNKISIQDVENLALMLSRSSKKAGLNIFQKNENNKMPAKVACSIFVISFVGVFSHGSYLSLKLMALYTSVRV